MKTSWRILFCFLFIFSCRAWAGKPAAPKDRLSANSYVDEPRACYVQNRYPCALRFISHSVSFQLSESTVIYSARETALVIYGKSTVRLLTGKVWVQSSGPMEFSQGLLTIQGHGDFWLEKDNDLRVLVRTLNGNVSVSYKGAPAAQDIPSGFENWFDGVNQVGQLEQGILRPIDPLSFLPEWVKVAVLPKAKVHTLVDDYKKSWSGAVAESSGLYQEIATRRVASSSQRESAEELRQVRAAQEKERLLRMFRSQYYNQEP